MMSKFSIGGIGWLTALTLVAALGACQSAPPPPPNYMVEMDDLSLSFGRVGDQLSKIGDQIISLEDDRFQLSSEVDAGLSDGKAESRVSELMADIEDVRIRLADMASRFSRLSNAPSSLDRNKEPIYKIHNAAMRRLFVALLGKDEEDKIKTARNFDSLKVEAAIRDEKRLLSVAELRERGILTVPRTDDLDRVGYLDLLEDYLDLNMTKLKGLRLVTVCETTRVDKNKYECVIHNTGVTTVLGGPRQQTSRSTRRTKAVSRWSDTDKKATTWNPSSMWYKLYDVKERQIVNAMKTVIKYRKRIATFTKGTS